MILNSGAAGENDRSWSRADAILIAIVCSIAVVSLGKDINRGGLADADSSAHLMDGVLIHDWLKAGPHAWLHPIAFAEAQYGHYPTLGLGAHYPPGFAIVEAAFFFAFGISSTTGRICVAFFGVLLAAGTYVFARRLLNRIGATLASIVMLTMPATTLWGRQTMLEIPMLAAMVWASLLFLRYLEHPTWKRLAFSICGACLALTFKQTAIALLGAIVLTMSLLVVFRAVPMRHAAVTAGAGLITLLAVCLSLDHASSQTVSSYGTLAVASWRGLVYYARIMRYQTGSVVLAASFIGALIALIQRVRATNASKGTSRCSSQSPISTCRRGANWLFIASWLLVAYSLATIVSLKVPRFIYVALFPFAILSALAATGFLALIPFRHARVIGTAAFAIALIVPASMRCVRHSPEFDEVVAAHRDEINGQAVLFSGLRDGDFVFAAREQLGVQKCIILRASKLLYTCTAGPNLDLVSYVQSPDDVRRVMRRFAFETVIVERENRVGTNEDRMLRAYLLSSGDYKHVAEHQLFVKPGAMCNSVWVDVYRLDRPLERQVQSFDIPMPRTGHTIRIDLSQIAAKPVDRT